jgi:hypothetical protein
MSNFSFGADTLVSTAVASFEALAIFAREGVDSAAVWGQVRREMRFTSSLQRAFLHR